MTIIRGEFSDNPTGKTLRHMAAALDRATDEFRYLAAIEICQHAEQLTSDPQWPAVRKTLEIVTRKIRNGKSAGSRGLTT